MEKLITSIKLDMVRPNNIVVYAKQYDINMRFISVRILNNGTPYDVASTHEARINVCRADKQMKSFAGEVNPDGTVTVPVPYFAVELDGRVMCDVSLIGSTNEKITTLRFYLQVEPASYDGDVISEDTGETAMEYLEQFARSLDHSEVVSPVLTEATDGRLSLLALSDRKTYITRGLYDADAWYLEMTLPTDLAVSSAFDCILTLPVGAVGLQVTAPANIKWQGDNVVSGAFCPTVNTIHDIYLRWNGYNYTATVMVSDWEETSSE